MMRQLNIVLIGHGSIANYVVGQIVPETGIHVTALICREDSLPRAIQFANNRFPTFTTIEALDPKPDLVVDCAGHTGLSCHGPIALEKGIDMISISTGALSQPELVAKLEASAAIGDSTIRFLSGAVGGIDALTSANIGGNTTVRYTGRKPPRGWLGSPAENRCDLLSLDKPFEHFSGTAREAARLYPKNANVAATIALASIGLDNVMVRLIADPSAEKNIHEIEASGDFGDLSIRLAGNPLLQNPKSSALAAMSIVAELKRRISLIQI